MVPSVIDYLLQLPEAMHFARVQELCGDGVFFYRMLSEYGNGTFQLIEFEDDLLLILIGDYTPKDTFEKITEISEDYMEISQFETDSSSFKIGGRKRNQNLHLLRGREACSFYESDSIAQILQYLFSAA